MDCVVDAQLKLYNTSWLQAGYTTEWSNQYDSTNSGLNWPLLKFQRQHARLANVYKLLDFTSYMLSFLTL